MISVRFKLVTELMFMLCICTYTAKAQNNEYNFSRVDIENGLSHNQVYSIFRDSTGFAWFGTASGLNRFDGYTCKVFTSNPNNSASLGDMVADDYDGSLPKMWRVLVLPAEKASTRRLL